MSRLEGIEATWPKSTKDVPLPSLSEGDCIAAIEHATQLIYDEDRDDDGALWIRFILPEGVLYEDDFYEHVRANCPGAVPALRKLIDTFTKHWENDFPSGGIFAAYALAYLDEASLPLVGRHFRVIDSEHNGEFNREKIEALIAKHGWTLPMVDFVIAWIAQTQISHNWDPGGYRHGLETELGPVEFARRFLPWRTNCPSWWIKGGLRDAAKNLMSAPEFAQHALDVLINNNAMLDYNLLIHFNGNDEPVIYYDGQCYFGIGVIEDFYIEFYDTVADGVWPRLYRRLRRMQGSLNAVMDEARWRQMAQGKDLDWDREFFIEFRKLAAAKGRILLAT